MQDFGEDMCSTLLVFLCVISELSCHFEVIRNQIDVSDWILLTRQNIRNGENWFKNKTDYERNKNNMMLIFTQISMEQCSLPDPLMSLKLRNWLPLEKLTKN